MPELEGAGLEHDGKKQAVEGTVRLVARDEIAVVFDRQRSASSAVFGPRVFGALDARQQAQDGFRGLGFAAAGLTDEGGKIAAA